MRRAAWLLLALGACGFQQVAGTPAKLSVVAEPPTASVYVDERYVATAQAIEARPRTFPPGTHRVTLEAPGHFPHDVEVELTPGVTTLRIALRPIPP
ncbi:MAG: PEGA domain-containing protein [Myxococcota bacterium]